MPFYLRDCETSNNVGDGAVNVDNSSVETLQSSISGYAHNRLMFVKTIRNTQFDGFRATGYHQDISVSHQKRIICSLFDVMLTENSELVIYMSMQQRTTILL